ncbi:MAG: hypothetical protein JWL71_861, partial [Acidobacteria bacterium]|nr:hypothetical protein [Acidobacteriota bacterium]
ADVVDAPAASTVTGGPNDADPSVVLSQWQNSVVSVWMPESRATGFLINAAGLVLTNQRAIGTATAVQVQLAPTVKVAARVLVADRARDVAVLWIDPARAASLRPVPLECADRAAASFASGQRFVAIGAPLRGPTEVAIGDILRVAPRAAVADFRLAPGSLGGPVFGAGGSVAGLSSVVDDADERARRDARIVPVADACAAVASAEKAMPTAQRPVATLLPVEPSAPFPADALIAATPRGEAAQSLYRMSSANFDVTLLTPPLIYGAQHNTQQTGRPTDFGAWSDYFADGPAVLAVRVTPKLAESFWTTVARGAAYTQGVAVPAIKHFKPGFSRLRAYCGETEVFPIHPFTIEQRVSETDAVREGLYVFDPQALGPHCTSVKLGLYSEKEPDKPDTRPVDRQLIERIWQDFAPSRPG